MFERYASSLNCKSYCEVIMCTIRCGNFYKEWDNFNIVFQ